MGGTGSSRDRGNCFAEVEQVWANGKLEEIDVSPCPENVSQLRAFLGLVNSYHKFQSNLATKLQSLEFDREALVLVWGIKKFHNYLYGRHFVLETDHKPHTPTRTQHIVGGKLLLLLTLSNLVGSWQ
eukprot:Em0002g121a